MKRTYMMVHNILEARALLKEAYKNGEELDFHLTEWTTHGGRFLFISHIYDHHYFMMNHDDFGGEVLEKVVL